MNWNDAYVKLSVVSAIAGIAVNIAYLGTIIQSSKQ